MSGPRLNRNGIPILDPPREANRLPRPARCLPDQHAWGPPVEVNTDYDWVLDEGATCYAQTCRRCGERDSYWRPWRSGRP